MRSLSISWNRGEWESTWLRGMFPLMGSFEETVARLITLSGQNPTARTDGYKVSVEFEGRYKGNSFTLYDYKEDRDIHIGGTDRLDVNGLIEDLTADLLGVDPTPYTAKEYYDREGQHSWSK